MFASPSPTPRPRRQVHTTTNASQPNHHPRPRHIHVLRSHMLPARQLWLLPPRLARRGVCGVPGPCSRTFAMRCSSAHPTCPPMPCFSLVFSFLYLFPSLRHGCPYRLKGQLHIQLRNRLLCGGQHEPHDSDGYTSTLQHTYKSIIPRRRRPKQQCKMQRCCGLCINHPAAASSH